MLQKIIITLFFLNFSYLYCGNYNIKPLELTEKIHYVNSIIFQKDIIYWDILINGTISAETLYGAYNGNGNLSLAQISKDGFGYIKSRITKEDKELLALLGYEKEIKFEELKKDNVLALAYCALYYKYKLQEIPPKNLEECAKVWKKYYNTCEGKGKPKDFIVKFNSHGLKPLINYYCLNFSKLRKINIYKRTV